MQPHFTWVVFLLSILNGLYTSTNAEVLNCRFEVVDEWDLFLPTPYICEASPVNFQKRITFDYLKGTHKSGKRNDDVRALKIFDENCPYFPSGVDKLFKNLHGIAIQNSYLKVIMSEDLEPFTELVSLSLYGNEITSLEFGLFKHNPKLNTFSFYGNAIVAVADDLFDNLKNLKEAFFQENKCIDMSAEDEVEFVELKKALLEECAPTQDMRTIYEIKAEKKECNTKVASQTSELLNIKNDYNKVQVLNQKCKEESTNAMDELGKCEKDKSTQEATIVINKKECDQKLERCKQCDDSHTDIAQVQNALSKCESIKSSQTKDLSNLKFECAYKESQCQNTISSIRTELNVCRDTCSNHPTSKPCIEQTTVPSVSQKKEIEIICGKFDGKTCYFSCANIPYDGMVITKVRLPNGQIISPGSVTELIISGFGVVYLPTNIGEFFPNLNKLTIDGTEIETINEGSLAGLEKLQTFTMTNGRLTTIHKDAFTYLINCEVINLSHNYLTCVDGIFSSLNKLTTLILNYNQIISFDFEDLKNLTYLENVQFEFNNLIYISSTEYIVKWKIVNFGGNKCINLKYPDNDVELISETVKNKCPYEVEIECEYKEEAEDYVCITKHVNIVHKNSKITKVSGQHKNRRRTTRDITKFVVKDQNMQYIPHNFHETFTSVNKVEIDSSNLKELIMFKRLVWIRIVRNDLNELNAAYLEGSPDLQYLDFSHSNIYKFPLDFFKNLMNLKEVNLEGNKLTTLSWETFKYLINLEILRLKGNLIRTVEWNWDESKLVYLDMSGNTCANGILTNNNKYEMAEKLKAACIVEAELEYDLKKEEEDYVCYTKDLIIQVENTGITKVTGTSTIKHFSESQVTKFVVCHQHFEYFPVNFNKLFPNLEKIEVESSKLKKITRFTNIKWIRITGNVIIYIDENAFTESADLTYLDLSNNNICKLPNRLFESNLILQEINLENNRLTRFKWSMLSSLYELKILRLANNQIKIIDWMKITSNIHLVDLTGNICINDRYEGDDIEHLANEVKTSCGSEVEIFCDFKQFGKEYVCLAKNLVVESENTKVLHMNGNHIRGKSNANVVKVIVRNQNVYSYPYNILDIFENLQRFEISNRGVHSYFIFVDGRVLRGN